MIVYVESNFILEIAHLREEHENCDRILNLSVTGEIQLVLPAFSVGEVYEAQTRRAKRRAELHGKLNAELGELARSRPYRDSRDEFILRAYSLLCDAVSFPKQTLVNSKLHER